jgi:hypothetical protein
MMKKSSRSKIIMTGNINLYLPPAPHYEPQADVFGLLSPSAAPHEEGFGSLSPVPQDEGTGFASPSFDPHEEPQEEEVMLIVSEAM